MRDIALYIRFCIRNFKISLHLYFTVSVLSYFCIFVSCYFSPSFFSTFYFFLLFFIPSSFLSFSLSLFLSLCLGPLLAICLQNNQNLKCVTEISKSKIHSKKNVHFVIISLAEELFLLSEKISTYDIYCREFYKSINLSLTITRIIIITPIRMSKCLFIILFTIKFIYYLTTDI